MTTELDWYIKEGEKDITAQELMVKTLVEMTTSAFEELVRLSGKAAALAAVKPYRCSSGPVVVSEARKKMPIKGNGPVDLLLAYAFGSLAVVPPENVTGKVYENGIVGHSRGCLFKNASPEFCMFISHYSSEGVADALNKDYECIWTHHETNGDPCCRYVFKKKSDPISVLGDMGKELFALPKFDIPKEQCRAAALWTNGHFLHDVSCAFVDLHGEERTREVLGANAFRIGHELGSWLAQQRSELKGDAVLLGRLVRAMGNSLGQRDNFVVASHSEVINEISECSEQVLSGEVCRQYRELFRGMLNAIDLGYEMSYDQLNDQGGKMCRWTIRRRSSSAPSGDPFQVLKMRFASGELTKEEYLEMRHLLEQ